MQAGGENEAWMDGAIVDGASLTIPLMSNAVFRGTSVFDVMPVAALDGTPHAIGLDPHFRRLLGSADQMGLDHGYALDDLTAAAHQLGSRHSEPIIIRTVIANGGGSGGGSGANIVTAMTVEPWERPRIESMRLDTAWAKVPAEIIPPHVKVAAIYAAGLRAESAAIAAGYDGIVNVAPDGTVLEGVSASIGIVIDGSVRLPPHSQVLDSVTRRLAEDVAVAEGIAVEVNPIQLDDLDRASGGFIASSTKMVVPLRQIGAVELDPDDPVVVAIVGGVDAVIAGRHRHSRDWLTPLRWPRG